MTRAIRWAALLAAAQSLFANALAFAQSQAVDLTVKTEKTTTAVWYNEWWIWAAGVAVFLIIIVALTNRGSRA